MICSIDFWMVINPCEILVQEKLRNAAKARIYRMVKEKKKRSDLAVNQRIKDQWNSGTQAREDMARTLQEVNWCKARVSESDEYVKTTLQTFQDL